MLASHPNFHLKVSFSLFPTHMTTFSGKSKISTIKITRKYNFKERITMCRETLHAQESPEQIVL